MPESTPWFANRRRELAVLQGFWDARRAQCIPITGRRRVGKTSLVEQFALGKRVVYYRCQLRPSAEQVPLFGAALAEASADPLDRAEPPRSWAGVFALIERLTRSGRLLLVLDEVPYWVARDESLPSLLQNWWDAAGRHLDVMLVLCGSAVQMMERLLTGAAPLAGCVTGRLPVRPFDFREAAEVLSFADPADTLAAYGILGGVPLYLSLFEPHRSLRDNVARHIASPSARLYVEPEAVFAADHSSYDRAQAMAVLRTMASGEPHWSKIQQKSGVPVGSLPRLMEVLTGDLGLVQRLLPITESRESRTYRTRYVLTDNFFRFWFRFIEPNRGTIEFGGGERLADSIVASLPDYLGPPFEAVCRDWVRLALAQGVLAAPAVRVGTWWAANEEVDVVGLDAAGRVALAGECKWRNAPFDWAALEAYLAHLRALGDLVRPDVLHVLFSKSGFTDRVLAWAGEHAARTLAPADLLAAFPDPLARTEQARSANG